MKKTDNGWAEQGGYMAAKITKLNNQFESGTKKQISDIFAGISIFIDGYTEPTDCDIKNLMQLHGGKFLHYYVKQSVTHIVASTLPNSKVRKLTDEKVVTANWILDSVAAGKLLDWSNYELYSKRHASDQNIMKQFLNQNKKDNGKTVDTGALSLSEFYAKSRLHHLSSWANELKNYFQTLRDNDPDSNFPGRMEFLEFYNSKCDKNILLLSEPIMMHIDMDCFFASVGIRNQPDLIGQPVVVTHSKGSSSRATQSGSMSEIASCSYEARKYGIKNGMHLGRAKELCPNLTTISYNFDDYLQVAKTLYKTVSRFTYDIEVGSCDELYMNLADIIKISDNCSQSGNISVIHPLIFAEYLRSKIQEETRCPSSCGVGSNLLLCKLATKKAKPNGQYWLTESDAVYIIKEMNVRDLPGIGRAVENKLKKLNIANCGQLQQMSLSKLKSDFGSKFGQRLYDLCRGRDNRVLQAMRQRKSISAEINYGIRLTSMPECENLFRKLSTELSLRLISANMTGGFLMLKLMVRHPEADVESAKYLGHGICNNFSKSQKLSHQTNNADVISENAIKLFKQFHKDVKELRGVGLVMQKLETDNKSNNSQHVGMKIDNYFPLKSSKISDHKLIASDCKVNYDNDESGSDDDNNLDDSDDDCTLVGFSDSGLVEDSNEFLSSKVSVSTDNQVKEHVTANQEVRQFQMKTAENLNGKDLLHFKQATGQQTKTTDELTLDDLLNDENSFSYKSTDEVTIDYLAQMGQTSLDSLKAAVSKWVNTECVPEVEDVVIIRDQIGFMILDDVSAVREMMIHLSDCIESKHSGSKDEMDWWKCYDHIINFVQSISYQEFGVHIDFK